MAECSMLTAQVSPQSLRDFNEKARHGGIINIVFLGGSVTWGANASDPQTTSYRGRMMQYLLDKYPNASIRFHDAAIGGTGSDLALFRLDRDVLAYKPDLVFLDFTANDNPDAKHEQILSAYEHLVRQLVASGSAIMPVLICFKWHAENVDAAMPESHLLHLKILDAYGCPAANIVEGVRAAIKSGATTQDKIWSLGDGAHPGDTGYELFFEIVRDTYNRLITEKSTPHLPTETVFADRYPTVHRQILVEGNLPSGWKRDHTRRTSMWFDGLSSRWMGDVAVAHQDGGVAPQPLEVSFRGSLVGLFGERDSITPPFRVWIDGKAIQQPNTKVEAENVWKIDSSGFAPVKFGSGNLFAWTLLANDLTDGSHVLKIEPLFQQADPKAELRIESVCSAGR